MIYNPNAYSVFDQVRALSLASHEYLSEKEFQNISWHVLENYAQDLCWEINDKKVLNKRDYLFAYSILVAPESLLNGQIHKALDLAIAETNLNIAKPLYHKIAKMLEETVDDYNTYYETYYNFPEILYEEN